MPEPGNSRGWISRSQTNRACLADRQALRQRLPGDDTFGVHDAFGDATVVSHIDYLKLRRCGDKAGRRSHNDIMVVGMEIHTQPKGIRIDQATTEFEP